MARLYVDGSLIFQGTYKAALTQAQPYLSRPRYYRVEIVPFAA